MSLWNFTKLIGAPVLTGSCSKFDFLMSSSGGGPKGLVSKIPSLKRSFMTYLNFSIIFRFESAMSWSLFACSSSPKFSCWSSWPSLADFVSAEILWFSSLSTLFSTDSFFYCPLVSVCVLSIDWFSTVVYLGFVDDLENLFWLLVSVVVCWK